MNILIQTHYTQNILKIVNGGLEVHINQILKGDGKNTYYIFMPNEDRTKYILTKVYQGKIIKREYWQYSNSKSKIELSSVHYSSIIKEILINYGINLVHIHNCIGHTFDTPTVAKQCQLPVFKSVHDMYDISGEVFKSDYENRFNDVNLINEYGVKNLDEWKKTWIEVTKIFYEKLDLVIFFSKSTELIYREYFDVPNSKIIPHGIEYNKEKEPIGKDSNKFVYIGRISVEKGVNELIELFKTRTQEELYLFGPVDFNNLELVEKLPDNIFYCGTQSHESLKEKLKIISPKAAFILANWPETFNYVLSELIQLGIYPIVSDQGALAEKVSSNDFGIVLNKNFTMDDLNKAVDNIDYNKYYETWKEIKELPTVNDMVTQYNRLYEKNGVDNINQSQKSTKITGMNLLKTKFKYFLVRNFINTSLWKKYLRPVVKK